MKKNLFFYFLSIVIIFFSFVSVHAEYKKVEDIFVDINADFEYLHELQHLYDKGMIYENNEKRFYPEQNLTRDDFVGILMEVNCEECINPNVGLNLYQQYNATPPFFDVGIQNKNYYCIAVAKQQGYVQGYQPGTTCHNGTQKENSAPFCSKNGITLEEALAVVMRTSGMMSLEQAQYLQEILQDQETQSIAGDVYSKYPDGSMNSFYPYLEKALTYKISEYTTSGEKIEFSLLETNDVGNINPSQNISKGEFLRVAYVALRSNACKDNQKSSFASAIKIMDKSCKNGDTKCRVYPQSSYENTFDIFPLLSLEKQNESGLTYFWTLYHTQTQQTLHSTNKYLNNYLFPKNGKWELYLEVKDQEGNISRSDSEIYIYTKNNRKDTGDSNNDGSNTGNDGGNNDGTDNGGENEDENEDEDENENDDDGSDPDIDRDPNNPDQGIFSVSIDANPQYGPAPLPVQFRSRVIGKGPFRYSWDFGDGSVSTEKNPSHIYDYAGNYQVALEVTDANDTTLVNNLIISVTGLNCSLDTDNDGINNCIDLCISVAGEESNKGCPVFETICYNDTDCGDGFRCDTQSNSCLRKTPEQNCLYSGGSVVYGTAVCDSCPCQNTIDFSSQLKKCDIIFPAITSPDGKTIYSRGNYFQIK